MPNALARAATAWPIRPKPTTARRAPRSSRPSQPRGSHVCQSPSRTARSASGSRRAAASSSAIARSAVASVSTSGVTPTGMPRAARRRQVDVVAADREVRDRAQLRRSVEQRRVDALGEQAQQAVGGREARGELRGGRRQVAGVDDDVVPGGGQPIQRAARQAAGDEHVRHPRRRYAVRVLRDAAGGENRHALADRDVPDDDGARTGGDDVGVDARAVELRSFPRAARTRVPRRRARDRLRPRSAARSRRRAAPARRRTSPACTPGAMTDGAKTPVAGLRLDERSSEPSTRGTQVSSADPLGPVTRL